MNEISLTKNAATVLKKLYDQYKARVRKGMSNSEAADFGDSKAIHRQYFPKWEFEDLDAACAELLRAKLLSGFRADGYVFCATLSDDGIAFSENNVAKNASTFFGRALELIQAIRSRLPW